tara:strand:- start:315 stop:860 length:546 start_codon:yes stop_codon:yes gene_type:complete
MKIYTKKGDSGYTQLLGGTKVLKCDDQIECYGTIDELNAFIGNIYDQNINVHQNKVLKKIQNQLFNLGSIVAYDNNKKISLPIFNVKNITLLENEIDLIDQEIPKLTTFILPSGHNIASKCHIARTICRRAERNIVKISKDRDEYLTYIKYLNRLSDYLFVLARYVIHSRGLTETKWEKDY